MKPVHKLLYLIAVAGSFAVFAFSLGEILWGTSGGPGRHWTEKLFYGICHRLPGRTYHSGELMMAVNTRCFGVFAGNFAGWLFVPFFKKITVGKKWPIFVLLIAILIQIADYTGNMAGIWENTNHSRAFLGAFLGFAVPVSVADMFCKKSHNNKQ